MITKIKMCKLLQKEISSSNDKNPLIHHWSKTFPLFGANFFNPNCEFIYPIYQNSKSNSKFLV